MATEFESGGRKFRFDKMGALEQGHVLRRVLPLAGPLAGMVRGIVAKLPRDADGKVAEGAGEAFAVAALSDPAVFDPVVGALSQLSDEAFDYVVGACLATVKLETAPGTWMELWEPRSRRCVDLELNDLGKLLPVVARVLKENLGGFFAGLLTSLGSGTAGSRA